MITCIVNRKKEDTRLSQFHLFIGSWNVGKSSAEMESLKPWISSGFREL
jgi:hypothetical protein